MELLFGLGIGTLVYMAFVFDLFGFLARDELWLRLLMLAASALYLVYYFFVAGEPLWDALFTNGALALVNLVMIFVVIAERTTFAMTRETAELYRSFDMLNPGQFRRLMRHGTSGIVTDKLRLATRNEALTKLYFVSDGPIHITKRDTEVVIADKTFIGEVAYLQGSPATATVELGKGARYVVWDHEVLARLKRRSPALRIAMAAQFNRDLLAKVAASMPLAAET